MAPMRFEYASAPVFFGGCGLERENCGLCYRVAAPGWLLAVKDNVAFFAMQAAEEMRLVADGGRVGRTPVAAEG
jgi:hypothetical protein